MHGGFGIGAAHVGLHPAWVQADRTDTPVGQIDREALEHLVDRRLGASVDVTAAAAVIIDTAHLAADHRNQLVLAGGNLVDESLHQHQRRDAVDLEYFAPTLRFYRAKVGAARAINTGVAEQNIDRPVTQLLRQSPHLRVIGDIERMHFDSVKAFAERPECVSSGWIAATGEHRPAIRGKLLGEFQADASIGARYQDSWIRHRQIPRKKSAALYIVRSPRAIG